MKISPSISISYNPTITLSPSDEDDGTSVANKRSSGSSVFTLTLNALAYGVFSRAKNRLNADGNYYTLTFPDDFVLEINSTDKITTDTAASIQKDPFLGYRADSAPYQIDTALNVTIEIPPGMNIGTNSFARFMSPFDMKSVYSDTDRNVKIHSGGTNYATINQNVRAFSADPCILINYGSHKVSTTTLQNSTITIENSGNTIGGGGYGGVGGIVQSGKGINKRGGGGGGAGMGLHEAVTPGSAESHLGSVSYTHLRAHET